MSSSNDLNIPRSSDAVKEAAGKSATASGDRGGSNSAKPKAIGGKPNRQKVTFFAILILIGHLKLMLLDNMKLANEPRVHCSFYRKLIFAKSRLDTLDYIIFEPMYDILLIHFTEIFNFTKIETVQLDSKIAELKLNNLLVYHGIIIYFIKTILLQLYDNNIVISILQANSKRQVDESILEEDSKKKAKKARGEKPKLKYSDVAKAGHIMLEVRSSNPMVELGQPDYDTIETGLANAYVNLPVPRPTQIPRIFQMGLSQGGSWIGAKDEFTLQFALIHIPTLTMPPGTGYYQYHVYGPDNRPNKYFKTTCPVRFWDTRDNLLDIIKAFHPELTENLLDRFGIPRVPHLRISSGLENPEDIVNGYFPFVLEAEEALGPVLGRLGGILTILATSLRLVGGGIEVYINEANAAAAAKVAAANATVIDINMETEQTSEIPLAPPQPGASTSTDQSALLPPPPALQQMRPRTPPPQTPSPNAN